MKAKAIKWLDGQVTDDMSKGDYDIVQYLKKLVRADKAEDGEKPVQADWRPYFEKLWKLYPRKVAKQNATSVMERKMASAFWTTEYFVPTG